MKDERIENNTIKDSSVQKQEQHGKYNKKKKMIAKFIRKSPLAFMIVSTTIIFSVAGAGYSLANDGKVEIGLKKPMVSSLATMINSIGKEKEKNQYEFDEGEMNALIEEITKDLPEEDDKGIVEKEDVAPDEEETGYITEFVKKKKVDVDSPYYSDPGLKALTTAYPYDTVSDEYFDDAVFIGDSRIEGMSLYSELRNAEFYAKQGTTIYKILGEKIVEMEVNGKNKKVTVAKALKEKKYAKIYLMLGINELGYKTSEDFGEEYAKVVNVIKKLQPDAKIFVLSIMNVTEEYDKSNDVYNNLNINSKNVQIAKTADGKNVFYLDVNEAVCDKKGYVKKEYAWDGVHLKAEYYTLLDDFFKTHAIENNIQQEETTKKSDESKSDKKEESEAEVLTKNEEETASTEQNTEETTKKKKQKQTTQKETNTQEVTTKNKENDE